MKKFFSFFGIITLLTLSFVYNSEVKSTIKMTDNLLIEIKENASFYEKEKKEATITKETIIPGVNGLKVDVNKSYNNMKSLGFFDETKLVYEKDLVKEKISDNKDKYIISGNSSLKKVSILVKTNNVNIDKKNITYVINDFNENILKKNIAFYCSKEDCIYLKTAIKKENSYCVNSPFCLSIDVYTLKIDEVNKYPFLYVKENLKNGMIFYFTLNERFLKEFELIVSYIENKGFEIVSLDELLKE